MHRSTPPFIPYPPIERLGVIGDRRTAAMVAADGTIAWWCLPNFDGRPVFGALLDAQKGGYFRLGPAAAALGTQSYLPNTAALVTRWDRPEGVLELTDVMLWPQTERAPEQRERRTILRRLRCVAGRVDCCCAVVPRPDFSAPANAGPDGFALDAGGPLLGLWSSMRLGYGAAGCRAEFVLESGAELWMALGLGEIAEEWSSERAHQALEGTLEYWQSWSGRLHCRGSRAAQIRRSALLVHLLSYAPTGAPIAAPTAALPERIGGWRNFDYRYSWVRDASLALSLLARLGFTGDEERYLDWLAQLPPGDKMPLQTAYRADGGTAAPVRTRDDLNGYRGSQPVAFGNKAFEMVEIGSFGYLADCIGVYVERGGPWKDSYWRLMRRIADFIAGHWRDRGTGIWELAPRDFVASRVLSWTVLDRTLKIAKQVGRHDVPAAQWRREMAAIRGEVMARGWSEKMGSFRQHYGADTVDAALLLMPLLEFLPAADQRVEATVAQVEARLMINGFVYRFVEAKFPKQGTLPLGEEEGSFAMCTSWLAHYYALRGERQKADALLRRLEATAPTGLFAEAIDGRSGAFLGNMPLLFSQAEYAKAALALARAEEKQADG